MGISNSYEAWDSISIEPWEDDETYKPVSHDNHRRQHIYAGEPYYESDETLSDLETCELVEQSKNTEFINLAELVKNDLEASGKRRTNKK